MSSAASDVYKRQTQAPLITPPCVGPPVRYSSCELNEGPAFIKALIEEGKPWEEQEELYASEFGISRSQFRLMKKFDLLGMREWWV